MKAQARPFRTDFYLWNGVSAIFFSSCVTPPHSHNTMQIVVDIQDSFKCKIEKEEWATFRQLILRENVLHRLDTNGSVQLLIYLDADTAVARILKKKYLEGKDHYAPELPLLSFIHPDELQRSILEPNPELLLKLVHYILGMLTGPQAPLRTDERIRKVEEIIAAAHPGPLTIRGLSERVFTTRIGS